jgi:hypothetical protein
MLKIGGKAVPALQARDIMTERERVCVCVCVTRRALSGPRYEHRTF